MTDNDTAHGFRLRGVGFGRSLNVAASLCREAGAYGLRQDPGFHRRSPRDPMVIVHRGVGFGRRLFRMMLPPSHSVYDNGCATFQVPDGLMVSS